MKIPRVHNSLVKTRFPTKYNPVRSAFKQQILTPAGVVYNPAPSAPNALETPATFLPSGELKARSYSKDAHDYPIATMPQLAPSPKRTYKLTAEDAQEIQRLRNSDPAKFNRKALAAKFGVSEFVIGLVSDAPESHATEMASRLAQIKGQWTEKRERARNHRERRKNFWLRNA